jgi:hypothetical protein
VLPERLNQAVELVAFFTIEDIEIGASLDAFAGIVDEVE